MALGELGVPWVLGSRSTELDGRRCNEGFVWSQAAGVQGVHTKQHIPNSPGYRETSGYEPGERHFRIAQVGALEVGFLICTEIMFNEQRGTLGARGSPTRRS
jgi:N-carbamoylputrescine amidase